MTENRETTSRGMAPPTAASLAVTDLTAEPTPPPISAIDNGARTDPAEVESSTMQSNMVDPYLYTNFIRSAAVNWSTSNETGKIIWSQVIAPRNANPIVSYISRLYNTWAGSLEFAVQIAGTGFNGGKLLVTYVPPNYDIEALTSTDLTIFPYTIIDPKQQEPMVFTGADERNIKFHWSNTVNAGPPGSFTFAASVGGTLVISVLLPLITSSTGNNSVNLAIFDRLGADFTFSQIVPPVTNPVATVYEDIQFLSKRAPIWNNLKLTHMRVQPITVDAVNCNTDLVPLTGIVPEFKPYQSTFPNYNVQYNQDPNIADRYLVSSADIDVNVFFSFTPSSSLGRLWAGTEGGQGYFWGDLGVATPEMYVEFNAGGAAFFQGCTVMLNEDHGDFIDPKFSLPIQQPETPVVQPLGESIVHFGYENDAVGVGSLSINDVRDLIVRGIFSSLSPNSTPVYQLYDKVTSLPLRYMRLNRQGYFSTNTVASPVLYDLENVELRYSFTIGDTEALPQHQGANLVNDANYHTRERLAKVEKKLASLN